ncbi:MAG TPA: macro domain-containing protein [bacterium]|nr:macro domain-containing protein [bacterium]HPN44853.1 macro domain-containing protein [bacterium]
MIVSITGDILKADAEALVNTVNTVGTMGKGLALQFKKAFPDNFNAYENACIQNELQLGKMFVFDRHTLINPRYIINFPTKKHWKSDSRYEDIQTGLQDLVTVIKEYGICSIAITPLGCGLGGLNWNKVNEMILKVFQELPEVNVQLFTPN